MTNLSSYITPDELKYLLETSTKQAREEVWEKVRQGAKKWAESAKNYKWLKIGYNKEWYDEQEVESSILGHMGYWEYLEALQSSLEEKV